MSQSSVFAFVAGGLAGAAVALLLSSRLGRPRRSLIGRRIREGVARGQKARMRLAVKAHAIDGAVEGRRDRNTDERGMP